MVEEPAARDTHLTAHVHMDDGVQRRRRASVRSIEHGNFMSKATMEALVEQGAYYVPTFISLVQRVETADETRLSPAIIGALTRTIERGEQLYRLGSEAGGPIGLGTDLWGPEAQKWRLKEPGVRLAFDKAANFLRSATVAKAELLAQRDQLGVIKLDAFADLSIVDGDALADGRILVEPQKNPKLIMKGGVIHNNALAEHKRMSRAPLSRAPV